MRNTETVGLHLVLRLQTTDHCKFNIITHLFAQLMSKIHLPMNVLHVNSEYINVENDVVEAFTLNAKTDVLSGLVSVYYYYLHMG